MIAAALQSGDAQEVSRFLKARGIAMPVLLDEDGGIRATALGYTSEPGLRLRLWLARD